MANNRSQTDKNNRKSQNQQELGKDKEFYNEDMSRKAVGRLFNDNVIVDAKPTTTVKETLNETEAEMSDKEYFDYINRTSQRNKKEQAIKDARREDIRKSREESMRELHKNKEEYTESNPFDAVIDFFVNSEARYIIIGALIFILILFTFLVVKINSTSSKLKEANTKLTEYEAQVEAFNTTLIENSALKQDIANLNTDLNEANLKIAELEAAGANTTGQTSGTSGTAGNPPAQTGERTHTVVTGDTVSGLATKYYGSASQANIDKIANANIATLPDVNNLTLGMVLIIP